MVKARSCRVSSAQATPKTILARTRELNQHRAVVSGGDDNFRMAREIKACSLEEREKILMELQNGMKVVIPTSHTLAMKADLGIPWSKLRAIRR